MAIPKIDLPTYRLNLKSSGKEVEFRPFIVKEEKILLLALETGEFDTILNAVKQVIKNCLITEIDIDDMPLFEIEYIFLNLRARSMGESVSLTYICENVIENKKCKNEMEVQIDLLKAALDMKVETSTLKINENVGIKLKYPTIETTKILNSNTSNLEVAVELIENCTEYLFDSDQVYRPSDMEPGEFKSFIEGLTQDQFLMIKSFFDNIPAIIYDTNVSCGKCGKNHSIHMEGLLDFFE
jgi:hypothetical protein